MISIKNILFYKINILTIQSSSDFDQFLIIVKNLIFRFETTNQNFFYVIFIDYFCSNPDLDSKVLKRDRKLVFDFGAEIGSLLKCSFPELKFQIE